MADFIAFFEPGAWKDFSKQHRLLREAVEQGLHDFASGGTGRRLAVWGGYGAGKTQFLYAVAEEATKRGLIPIYLHLNDLLDSVGSAVSPDAFAEHATALLESIAEDIKAGSQTARLRSAFRDPALLDYVLNTVSPQATKVVALIDEVEQAYSSLVKRVERDDDNSPLRAWLEDRRVFKVFAFAVGSLYVLGKADRERLDIYAIPAVDPACAKSLFPDISESTVNSLWWLARGKPRHLIKAVWRYQATLPVGAVQVYDFVSGLDSVSQAPYADQSQNAVPAAYLDQLSENELGSLLSIGEFKRSEEGFLFPLNATLVDEFAAIIKQAFGMEGTAYDLARYAALLGAATATQGTLAITEKDMPYFLRLSVDYLLEYERERLEKETVEGSAALQKLLEIHDRAADKGSEVFWKLQRGLTNPQRGEPKVPFAALYSAFPLPTTSPTLFGTDPRSMRAKYEELKEPVFRWDDEGGTRTYFLTSSDALTHLATSAEFREHALAPNSGTLVVLPHDAGRWDPVGFLHWLQVNERLVVTHLPLALSDFLLSLKAYDEEGYNPLTTCEKAESNSAIRRQVAFYRARLQSLLAEVSRRPRTMFASELPRSFVDLDGKVADKDMLALFLCQAFDTLSPSTSNALRDLRQFVLESRDLWSKYVSLADEALPHNSKTTGRPERPKLIDDVKATFVPWLDALRGLTAYVDEDEIAWLGNTHPAKLALKSFWMARRAAYGGDKVRIVLLRDQIGAVLEAAERATSTEGVLRKLGIELLYGQTAPVLDSLPQLRSIHRHLQEIVKSDWSGDRQFCGAVYERMLRVFIDRVGGEMAKVKADLAKIQELLGELQRAETDLAEQISNELAGFFEISSDSLSAFIKVAKDDSAKELAGKSVPQTVARTLAGLVDLLASASEEIERCRSAKGDIEALFRGNDEN